jgi:hypothetical protein
VVRVLLQKGAKEKFPANMLPNDVDSLVTVLENILTHCDNYARFCGAYRATSLNISVDELTNLGVTGRKKLEETRRNIQERAQSAILQVSTVAAAMKKNFTGSEHALFEMAAKNAGISAIAWWLTAETEIRANANNAELLLRWVGITGAEDLRCGILWAIEHSIYPQT